MRSTTPWFEEFTERPRFNVAPSQEVPLIRLNAEGQRAIGSALWGLVPSWTKGTPKARPINARGETVATNGMFRQAFARRRCLIPADGFYEWQGSKPPKQPYFIHMKDDGLFAFAGVWERWMPEAGAEPVDSCAIITTEANELMTPIHQRMPAILGPEHYDRWLSRDTPAEEARRLIRPFEPARMEARPVSPAVNRPSHDSADCIEGV